MTMTPEDCQFLYDGDFYQSMLYDAWDFSRYVAGKYRSRPARLTNKLTSALHLELKLGRANMELPTRYILNDAEHNVWQAMSNRTTLIPEAEKDLSAEKEDIFTQLRESPSIPEGYEAKDYDLNHLQLLVDLKSKGLAYYPNWASKPPWRPPELGTVGLSQRLTNMYYEYQLCWDLTKRPLALQAQSPREDLRNWLPFMHAPLHVAFLGKLELLPLGLWLTQKEFLRKGKIRDGIENKFVTWWKMDSLRTYYGIQLLLRRIAMNTWMEDISEKEIENELVLAKDAFEKTYKEQKNKTHDWLELACNFQNEELQKMISKTLVTIAEQEPCILDHADMGRKVIMLCEQNAEGKKYENALRICPEDDVVQCLGGICYRNAELDLKKPQKCGYLIEDISNAGGNFTHHKEYVECEDSGSRWGGTDLEGGILFHSIDNAIAYLKQYFQIYASADNEYYTQEWVNWV